VRHHKSGCNIRDSIASVTCYFDFYAERYSHASSQQGRMITISQASQEAGPCTVLHEIKNSRPELRDTSMVHVAKVKVFIDAEE
jgi:hypothetical protein